MSELSEKAREVVADMLRGAIQAELKRQKVDTAENERVVTGAMYGWLMAKGNNPLDFIPWREALRDFVDEIKRGYL